KVDSQLIHDFDELVVAIGKHPIGDNVGLEVWRGTRVMDLSVPIENGFELYRRSCEAGALEGCYELGAFYESEGKDPARAASLYPQGCEAGNGDGCNALGFLYEKGNGVLKDSKVAAQFYERACNAGSKQGCENLALFFENGEGVEKDPARARILYEKSCSFAPQ